ncbi:carboxymuconolactone decarboxylase family protein [Phenylobacterium sp. LjRoot219]|uniref:carboxymuconolactone decarboxylase family protein n=1 Tax=Phenylobacterium sp. LjRoot219 TaxID=3342283 RepID=UPI003ECD11D2
MAVSFVADQSGYDAEAIAAREAEILGKPQRVPALKLDEVGQDTWDIVNDIRKTIGLPPATDIPGYGLTMAKHPQIMCRQLEMGMAIFGGKVSARERELAVLRIGWLLRAPYEWGEHVDIGQRYGVTKDEILRVIEGSGAPGWSEHEAAILRAVEEILANLTVSDATWATLAKSWDEQQLLEFPMMVGQYVCTAIVQNTLRIRLEEGNPGLTYR